ncbi:Probable RNA polymerase sigma factor fecI [Delftia tsuruhatensis]|nr:Probable RNA polymerase sigma factor fecI [Delftia tsuruhatensis]CAC9684314.1 Probable RNA polymerase sigma factor fecI [Delftia tsuruhatensis]
MSPSTDNAASHALGSMYVQHNHWLVAWLQRKLGNRSDAADLAQDTFTRIWAGAKGEAIVEIHEPRAYLTTVARRLLVNHLERRSLEQAYLASLHLLPQACAPSVEARAILLETLQELDALLDALPAKVRTAFLMSQLEGLSYEEIAAQMQLSVRTVTRYMAQGFRQCLQVMLHG